MGVFFFFFFPNVFIHILHLQINLWYEEIGGALSKKPLSCLLMKVIKTTKDLNASKSLRQT